MKQFLAQFADSIQCTLGCFDRLLFKGYLPISHPASMERWLACRGFLLKDFKGFVTTQSDRLKATPNNSPPRPVARINTCPAPSARTTKPARSPNATASPKA